MPSDHGTYVDSIWAQISEINMQKSESTKKLPATKTLSLKVKTLEPKTAPAKSTTGGAGSPIIGYT